MLNLVKLFVFRWTIRWASTNEDTKKISDGIAVMALESYFEDSTSSSRKTAFNFIIRVFGYWFMFGSCDSEFFVDVLKFS